MEQRQSSLWSSCDRAWGGGPGSSPSLVALTEQWLKRVERTTAVGLATERRPTLGRRPVGVLLSWARNVRVPGLGRLARIRQESREAPLRALPGVQRVQGRSLEAGDTILRRFCAPAEPPYRSTRPGQAYVRVGS